MRSWVVGCVTCCSIVLVMGSGVVWAQVPDEEREALIALYEATNGAEWGDSSSWLGTAGTECAWYGVECWTEDHVNYVDLGGNNLDGELPAELGNLSELVILALGWNQLSGSIPAELGGLTLLEGLYLSGNLIDGEIPASFANLTALQEISLGDNQLSGPLPLLFAGLVNLRMLQLGGNEFTGSIPPEFGELSNLENLDLSWNQLTGEIPAELGNLGLLQWLGLSSNQLNGDIPPVLGDLSNLRALWMCGNQLTGEIPPELGNLGDLDELSLCDNQLTGAVPGEFSGLTNLRVLDLGANELTGSLPDWLVELESLRYVYICCNQLNGEIPEGLIGKSGLVDLMLNSNQLSGEILAATAGQATSLTALVLSDNQFSGEIPVELAEMEQLRYLQLAYNQLTGEIPPEFGQLTHLRELLLLGNQLTGTIPVELGNLTDLVWLELGDNQLTGEIPNELTQLLNLEYFEAGSNQLTGEIPAGFGDLTNLLGLWIGNNNLTGEIPAGLGNLSHLNGLGLYGNQLRGEIPSGIGGLSELEYLDVSANQLSGEIPTTFGNLENLIGLWMGDNQLTGTIPPGLGGLSELQYLSLGLNQLSGSIPATIGGLENLHYFDIYLNQLSGPIPAGIGNLTNLRGFWASENRLSGPIPAEIGHLVNLEELALGGNDLSGSIPPELGDAGNLVVAYLGWNHLSGEIPPELANLENLRALWLTFNQLSGTIPSELGGLVNLEELQLGSNKLQGTIPSTLTNLENLWENWGLDIGLNALHTDDQELRSFLDSRHGGPWEATQTVAPTALAASDVGTDTAEFFWQSIIYSWDPGEYRVLAATSPGGPYELLATTGSKEAGGIDVAGLQPGTTYFIAIQTMTEPHEGNQNMVESELSEEISITTRGASECSLACAATVQTSAEVGEAINFDGSATASNCDGNVGFAWSFGDGQSSNAEDAIHSYETTGTYGWQMVATVDDVSCLQSGSVVVFPVDSECGNAICEPGETAWTCAEDCGFGPGETGRAGESSTSSVVPAAVGGIGGVGNTYWVSEAMIHNPGDEGASFTLSFTADDQPGQSIITGEMNLDGGEAVFYANVVEELFDVSDNGSMTIVSDQPLMFVSRTFNDQGLDGTYGQFLGAVSSSRAFGIGDIAYLTGLSEDGAFRSNVLFQELAGIDTVVKLSVYSARGDLDGSVLLNVPAHTKLQKRLLRLGFSDLSGGYATIEVTGGGQVVAIGSVIDESTGDAMTVDALHPSQVQLSGRSEAKTAIQAVDFSWSPRYPTAGKEVQFTDLSTSDIISWRWSFDDGGTSSDQHPKHTFNDAGSYRVTLAVSSSSVGSQVYTKTVTVEAAPTDAAGYLVAVVARLPGAENTVWRSDLWVMNPFANSQEVWLAYRPVGTTVVYRYPLTVRSGAQAAIRDVVGELFTEAGDGKGALHIFAPEGVFVSSRTYNLGALGTYGQAIPALGGGDLLAAGDSGRLLKLKSSETTRCNVGFSEFDGTPSSVRVRLYELSGGDLTLLDEKDYVVAAGGHRQINGIFNDMAVDHDVEQALATVEVLSGGRIYAYASSVDRRTGDAEFIPAMKE